MKIAEKNYMNNNQKKDLTSLAIFFPSVLAMAIIPILAQITLVTTQITDTYRYFTGTEGDDGTYYFVDAFSQCKAFAVVVFAIIMLALALVCCVYLFKRAEKRSLVYVGLSAVYVVVTLASALCSEYGEIAFYGQYDRAEGFFTTACYFVIFLFTMYAFKNSGNFRYIVIALAFCLGVNVIFGIFQLTGNDLIYDESFNSFITNRRYSDMITMSGYSDSTNVYGLLYHYNYVGSFTGMVVPLFTTLALFSKKISHRIFCLVFDIAALFFLIASTARSGMVAVAAALVVGIICFARVIAKHWKISVSVVAAAVVLVIAGNFATGGAFFTRAATLVGDIVEMVSPAEDTTDLFDTLPVREIKHNDDGSVSFVTQTDEHVVSFNTDLSQYEFFDKNGDVVEMTSLGNDMYTSSEERFKDIYLEFFYGEDNSVSGSIMYLRFDPNSSSALAFYLYGMKNIHMVDLHIGDRINPVNAEHIGFEGKELVGSSRGYIWSRTIPLLKNCLVTGYGADTFVYDFPQTDFLAKYYSYSEGFNITVDKPHNLYLQIFVSNGLIALIAFLGICLFYLIDSLRLYALKKEYRIEQIYGISVMLAIVGYLAAGMFNDSVVSVAPVFWILLGTGCALNTINRRMDKNIPTDDEEAAESESHGRKPSKKERKIEQAAEAIAPSILRQIRNQEEPKPKHTAENVTKDDIQELYEKVKNMKAAHGTGGIPAESSASDDGGDSGDSDNSDNSDNDGE
jgi:hypothetical protein